MLMHDFASSCLSNGLKPVPSSAPVVIINIRRCMFRYEVSPTHLGRWHSMMGSRLLPRLLKVVILIHLQAYVTGFS